MMQNQISKSHDLRESYHTILLIALFLFPFMSAGCDGDNNGGSEPDCVDIGSLEEFEDCPADGLTMVCGSLFCDFFEPGETPPNPPVLQTVIFQGECERIDCSTLECTLRSTDFPEEGEVIGIGTFTISTFLTMNELFGGIVVVDEVEQFDYVCNGVVL
jgi:hypothetical protein